MSARPTFTGTPIMAKIIAHYADCCFCERPKLDAEERTPTEPRFNFRAAARKLAARLGLERLTWNTCDRSATGLLRSACHHRPDQLVRLVWRYDYQGDQ